MIQLKSLLTYEFPGWLVDAAVMVPNNNETSQSDEEPTATLDVTGMFDGARVDSDENGIAGLGESPEARRLQMIVVREMCIREVVFLLAEVYRSTGRHNDCVRLADLVVDSEHELFKVIFFALCFFFPNRFQIDSNASYINESLLRRLACS